MSKTKNKEKSELELLRGTNRSLKSENRQLKRRVKELERKSYHYETISNEVIEEVEPKEVCDNCGKGQMIYYDLLHVKMDVCNLCGHKRNLTSGKK